MKNWNLLFENGINLEFRVAKESCEIKFKMLFNRLQNSFLTLFSNSKLFENQIQKIKKKNRTQTHDLRSTFDSSNVDVKFSKN